MKTIAGVISAIIVTLSLSSELYAQKRDTNYEESKVPAYELPDPLVFNDGREVKNARQWTKKRRPEILEIFAQEMYGHVPAAPEGLHFKTISEGTVYAGLGVRKVVRIYLDASDKHWFDVLIHLPKDAKGPVPMFVGLNFKSNAATLDERADFRWPYELLLRAGMGVATAWRDSIEPDGSGSNITDQDDICRDGGVRSWYNKGGDWGAISAWAWGLSRIVDYLETDKAVDCDRLAVIGHSRLGKAALWAGANDLRFDMVISNDSGCCGAALSRRKFGETFDVIGTNFPHWFTREFDKYKGREETFPADQHWLIALAAPRPVYVASATEDLWADPKGEWLSASNAASVYALFGLEGLDQEMPDPDISDGDNSVGYHVRTGKHNILAFDWLQYISFMKRHLFDESSRYGLDVACNQALYLAQQVHGQEGMLPKTFVDGKLDVKDYKWWTAGFFPGVLWQLYEYSGDEKMLEYAKDFTARVEPVKNVTSHHDLGFMLYCSFGHGYRLTGDETYRDVILKGSESLATRFNPTVGAIRSWDWNRKVWKFPVIIDNLMNLEMLCFASKQTGDDTYADMAKSHADVTMANHFRDDFSSWHVVSYDPQTGDPHVRQTHQGFSDDSAWARGQAWGLYGYTMMYRETGDEKYLQQACSIADFLVNHLNFPKDGIPYWDFNDPGIPDVERDASAAAIMASALLELSTLDKTDKASLWYETAVRQLDTLTSAEYLAEPGTNGGFILKHGVGNKPGNQEIDVPLTYADYYYVEAMLRLRDIDKNTDIKRR